MARERVPRLNNFGLVVPPSPEDFDYLSLTPVKKNQSAVNRHHLYWPERRYKSSKLSVDFRRHRLNSVWIPRTQHDELHSLYDGIPIPANDVMEAYLDEATLLDELDVCVSAVTMINDALYEGRVVNCEETDENIQSKLERIRGVIARIRTFEIISPELTQSTVDQARTLVTA